MRHASPIFAFVSAALVAGAGCGPEFAVVPRGGAPTVSASSPTGITMTALAEQWDADPADLADYVTPIAVELYNGSQEEVRVSYADFVLKDERGTRYPAISPFVPDEYGELELDLRALTPYMLAQRGGGVHVAPPSRGGPPPSYGGSRSYGGAPSVGVGGRPGVYVGGGGGGYRGGGYGGYHGYRGYGGRYIGRPPGLRYPHTRWGAGYWRPGGWNGFLVAPGLRGYYGPGLSYWGYGWGASIWGPSYGNWVYWWGPAYYPSRPSYDVIAYALPEGVIPPGGRVNGFVYFKKATESTRTLTLTWQMHTARDGRDLGSTNVVLDVLAAR